MIRHALVAGMLVFVIVMIGVAVGFTDITAASVTQQTCSGPYLSADKGEVIYADNPDVYYIDYSFSPDMVLFSIDGTEYNVEIGKVFKYNDALICPVNLFHDGRLMYNIK